MGSPAPTAQANELNGNDYLTIDFSSLGTSASSVTFTFSGISNSELAPGFVLAATKPGASILESPDAVLWNGGNKGTRSPTISNIGSGAGQYQYIGLSAGCTFVLSEIGVQLSPTPEPATFAAIGGALLLAGLVRFRRRA
jgi:hypothetical protein